MTSIPTNQILDLFGLNKDEKILNEFNSFLVETVPILGNLYITDHYICFYSNLLFFNRNITIPLNEITKLSLIKTNIEIKTKNKSYLFSSKEDIVIIYEKIKSICHIYNINNSFKNDLIPIKIIDSDKQTEEIGSKRRTTASSFLSNLSNREIINDEIEDRNEEIKFVSIDPNVDYEICKKIIDITPNDLFNKYFSNTNKETSKEKYYEWVGDYSNIKISDWKKIENNKNTDIEKFKKTENFSLSLHGVPLAEKSEISKTSIYYIDKDGTYYINDSSKSEGIPFSDSFTIESKIELHPYIKGTKTIFRIYIRVNFIKPIVFKSLIISQTKKNYHDEVNKWFEFIQEKGEKIEGDYIYENKKTETLIDKLNNNNDEEKIIIINESKLDKKKKKYYYKVYKAFINLYKLIEIYIKRIDNKSGILLIFCLVWFILSILIIMKKKEK